MNPLLKEYSMVAQLAELFVSSIYILGLVVVGSLIINLALATVGRIIGTIVDAIAGKPDER